MKKVRRWLRIRRAQEGVTALWTTAGGTPLTYWGGQSFFRRLKARSGVKRVHAHLLRHTAGQGALLKGATPGEVQEMLGHKTKAMTDRYTRTVKAQVAAANMPRYAMV
jgi:integrase